MTRRTSAAAYHEIVDNGLVGRRQRQVYEILYRHGPLTMNQVYEKMKTQTGYEVASHGLGPRLTELRDMGVAAEVGTVRDPITNMTVLLYDVTDQLPVKLPKKTTKDQIIAQQAARIATLEAEIVILRSKLPKQMEMLH